MFHLDRFKLKSILLELGIKPGDGVMVHSALQFLGIPDGGLGMYYDTICDTLQIDSKQGTLVVPTFNFGFAKGESFDQINTPTEEMGAFPEYVRQQPGVLRSSHPMQSICAVGRYAQDLCSRETDTAFETGSAFDRMLELDFKLLLLGADVKYTTMVHLIEQRMEVPYRYWKSFSGLVKLAGKEPEQKTFRMYVRDMVMNPIVDAAPIREKLIQAGGWISRKINYGEIATCRFVDFVETGEQIVKDNPYGLLKKGTAA